MRVMSLDFGSKTVGVAVCDPFMVAVRPVETIRRERPGKLRRTLARLSELARELEPERIIVGLPLNMDRTQGERCDASREFAALVEKRLSIPVVMHGEVLTTNEAYEAMSAAGVSKEKQKISIDAEAAVVILEDYLRNERNKGNLK